MTDPNFNMALAFTGPVFDIIQAELCLGYQVDDQGTIEHLGAALEANRAAHIVAWNVQQETDARAAKKTKAHMAQEEEDGSVLKFSLGLEKRPATGLISPVARGLIIE